MQVVSTYPGDRYSEKLLGLQNTTTPYVLHIYDVETSDYMYEVSRLPNPPAYFFSDSVNFIKLNGIHCYSAPFWLEYETKKFSQLTYNTQVQTKFVFNFMINKKQINRFLCLKLVEYFKLQDYNYTWSGIGRTFDMSKIIEGLSKNQSWPEDFVSYILAPVSEIDQKFVFFQESDKSNDLGQLAGFYDYGGNTWAWQNALSNLFETSAISLITESVTYDNCMHFTEKTLFAVLGLTFPIWIGGRRQAQEWANIGFDIFDDVINHDYQHRDSLLERCYYAFFDNLEILTNKKLASQLRDVHLQRLIKNRELILSGQLQKYNDMQFSLWPADLQQAISPTIITHFRR